MTQEILKLIKNLYDKVIQEENSEYNLADFGLTQEKIEPFLEKQRNLLLEYAENFLENRPFPIDKCREFYEQDIKVPYVVIDYHIKTLKKMVLKFALTDESYLKLEKMFESLSNSVADIHIHKDIHKNLEIISQSKFREFPLYNIKVKWAKEIYNAVLEKDFLSFPHYRAEECEFSEVLEYPESLMVCMDATLCSQIELLHQILHNNAEAFYRLMVQKKYSQAIFILKEFNENILKMLTQLKDLYHITYIDLENSFFKLIEILEYSDANIIISTIDIENLKKLNAQYGEEKIDEVLNEIYKILKNRPKEVLKNYLAIKGITSNFYSLHLNKNHQEFEKEIKEFSSHLNKNIKDKFPNIDIKINIASIELDKNIKYQKNELVRILFHLKKKSKEEDKTIFIYEEEDKKELKKWLQKYYYNVQFVEEKLKNKMIDVMLQPIYDRKNEIYSFEALARITDEDSLIPAGIFIDTIYELGKIHILDKLVLEALLEKKEWLIRKNRKVFVNTSPKSLVNKEYLEALKNFIKEFGAENILIEITEQQALKNFDILETLYNEYNVKFAIDDFGSGYSSLKTLLDMIEKGLIEVLKIDGSLICNLDKEENSQKISQIISHMCKVFNIKSLAEFVENEKTLKLLKEYGIDLFQGFYLSKPLRTEEILIIN